jgi:hypothetical protein
MNFDEDKYIVITGHLAVTANQKFEELADLLVEFHMRTRLTHTQMYDQLLNLMKSAYAMGFQDGLDDDPEEAGSKKDRWGYEVKKGRLEKIPTESDGSVPNIAFQMMRGIKLQRQLAELVRTNTPDMARFVRGWLLKDKLKEMERPDKEEDDD